MKSAAVDQDRGQRVYAGAAGSPILFDIATGQQVKGRIIPLPFNFRSPVRVVWSKSNFEELEGCCIERETREHSSPHPIPGLDRPRLISAAQKFTTTWHL